MQDWLVRWVPTTQLPWYIQNVGPLSILSSMFFLGTCWLTFVRSKLGSQRVVFTKGIQGWLVEPREAKIPRNYNSSPKTTNC